MTSISVIVPVYNVEKYLRTCIESVLGQVLENIELILIDDGSTDNSGKICDEYKLRDTRVIVIHKKNGGVSSARNVGLRLAKGKYVSFIDSDDYIKEDYFSTLFFECEKNKCDCVSQDLTLLFDDKQITVTHRPGVVSFSDDTDKYNYIINQVLQGKTGWEMCARIFKTEIIQRNKITICETCENYAEDLGFFLVFLMNCKRVSHVRYAGYYYVQRYSSMMDRNRNLIKMNALTEVSYFVYNYLRSSKRRFFIKKYPLIHFMIMKEELKKILAAGCYSEVPHETKKIKKIRWYKKQTKQSIRRYRDIRKIYGRDAFDYVNLCYYTIHSNYNTFKYLSALYYKTRR